MEKLRDSIRDSLLKGECIDKYLTMKRETIRDLCFFNTNFDVINFLVSLPLHHKVKIETLIILICLSYDINIPENQLIYNIMNEIDFESITQYFNKHNVELIIREYDLNNRDLKTFRKLCRRAYELKVDLTKLFSDDEFNNVLDIESSLDDGLTRLALSKIKDFNVKLGDNTTSIMNCVGCQDQLFQQMLDRGANLNEEYKFGLDILCYHSFIDPDINKVKYILKYKSSMSLIKVEQYKCYGRDRNINILEILHLLSSLENFEDYMRLNIECIYLGREELNFVARYIMFD